jgi:hypothetical protein
MISETDGGLGTMDYIILKMEIWSQDEDVTLHSRHLFYMKHVKNITAR